MAAQCFAFRAWRIPKYYERLSVLYLSEDGLSVTSEDQYFSSFNQRIRDVAVNPYTEWSMLHSTVPRTPEAVPILS